LRVCVRVDRELSAEDLAQQKAAYLNALQRFSPAMVEAVRRAAATESEWWPPLKRLLALAREYQATETAALALPVTYVRKQNARGNRRHPHNSY
jgi:hypothetical protein